MLVEEQNDGQERNDARREGQGQGFESAPHQPVKPDGAGRQEGRQEGQGLLSPVTFAWEEWPAVMGELMPLLRFYWEHGGMLFPKELPFDPDLEGAAWLHRYGRLKIYIARKNGSIIGLNSFNVGGVLFRKRILQATGLILYLLPSQRKRTKTGVQLIKGAEDGLRSMGCHLIEYLPSSSVDIGRLLIRLGYVQQGSSFQKLLRSQ